MSTSYSSRFYTSAGAVLPNKQMSGSNTGGLFGTSLSETIPTTDTDGVGDEHFLMPAPTSGARRLQGFWIAAGDMDTGAAALDADVVFRTVLNSVVTNTMVYDSSVSGLFSAVLAYKWVDGGDLLLPQADAGFGNFILLVNVAAATPAAANLTFFPLIK